MKEVSKLSNDYRIDTHSDNDWLTEGVLTSKFCSSEGAFLRYKNKSRLEKTLEDYNKIKFMNY